MTACEELVLFLACGSQGSNLGCQACQQASSTAGSSHWPKYYHLKPSKFSLPGEVNFTATAEALQSAELCGNEVAKVPALIRKDTVVKPLIVEVCEY